MPDMLITSLEYLLSCSKKRDYRTMVLSTYRTLARFLQDSKLTTRTLVAPDEEIPHDLKIWQSDLTQEEVELYRDAVQRWLFALDRGTDPTDTRILEQGLADLRKNRET